jgi:hypothetical protein
MNARDARADAPLRFTPKPWQKTAIHKEASSEVDGPCVLGPTWRLDGNLQLRSSAIELARSAMARTTIDFYDSQHTQPVNTRAERRQA